MRSAWILGAVVLTAASLFAADSYYATVDGIRWEYTVKAVGGDACVRSFSPHQKSVVIPSELDGHAVTQISTYLVQNDTTVEAIGIPATVRYLTYNNGNNPFMGGKALKAFRVDPDNPYFTSDNGLLYSKDKTVLYAVPGALVSVSLPSCLKRINDQAFQEGAIKGVELPDGLVEIGDSAFSMCRGITTMKIPGSVKKIGTSAFSWCVWMSEIQFEEGLETLGGGAFYSCNALRSVKLPRTLRELGGGTFGWCDGLESVDYPRGVTIDTYDEFYKCEQLRVIKYHGIRSFPEYFLNDVAWDCVLYVSRKSYGWGVEIPGTYNGHEIRYLSDEDAAEDGKVVIDVESWDFRDWVYKYDFSKPLAEHGAACLEMPAANPRYTIAEAYVAGLDPTDPKAEFRAVVTFDEKGEPVVGWSPKLTEEEEAKRLYLVLGKKKITDPWSVVEWDAYRYNFFSVIVDLR